MRIQKVIANMGIASRRAVEELIKQGRVKVNGKIAVLGTQLSGSEQVMIDNKIINYKLPNSRSARLLLLNKPLGVMCSHRAMSDHPLIYDLLPKLSKGKWLSVGRLDLNSQGLLLVTNNGDLLQKLLHPKEALKRVYKVRVRGNITPKQKQSLLDGILLNGNICKFTKLEQLQQGNTNSTWRVTLFEGRNREVRELFAAIGCQVNSLKRIAYGPFVLPHDLPAGNWFEIDLDVAMAKL